jgi:conjugal transfer pilus assembly protein TraF
MVQKASFKIIVALMGFFINLPFAQAGFFGERTNGWHWYQAPDLALEEIIEANPRANNVLPPMTATDIVKAYQKELEKRLHTAWVNPSFKNIEGYQRLQKDMMDRAENFSKSWMQVVYNNPELDHTIISPVNQKARHIHLDQEKREIAEKIKNLSENYGLFFFFSSNCEYCHQFAPIVKRFSETYGWDVLAISADGGRIEGFKNTTNDNGLLQTWGVQVLPALFAVDPNTGHVIPIAYGMTSLDEMEMRIMALIEETHKDNQ